MMQLKDETDANGLKWNSFSTHVCSRFGNTTYGTWSWFADYGMGTVYGQN